jgi:uncharacterized protein YecE (DUF72 family)
VARGRIHAGTSGYSYKEWKGAFYPADLPESRFLEFYVGKFSTVEVNNTFYRFPAAKLLEGWRDSTPPHFIFSVKANQGITHKGRLQGVEELTRDFVERSRLLGPKLGPILFQLPPYFRRDDELLARFLEALPRDIRYAFEFRHATWFDEKVFRRLEDSGAALCISEGEEMGTPRVSTGSFSYLRLRKEEYEDAELGEWSRWIRERLDEGRDVFVYLKHDEKGVSPERTLRLLEGHGS